MNNIENIQKQKITNISIKSDGSPEGTIITGPDGKKIGYVTKILIESSIREIFTTAILEFVAIECEIDARGMIIVKNKNTGKEKEILITPEILSAIEYVSET